MRLQGKRAILTGAARGIGLAFATRFIKEGAQVMIADINDEGGQAAAIELGDNAFSCVLDVSNQGSIESAMRATVDKLGGVDILINNAGIFDLDGIVDIKRSDFDRVFSVNVSGTLFMMQAAAKQMIAQGNGGRIINMASQAGRRGEPLVGTYCASKAAVISLTQSAGLNLIEHGINVNAIAPGVVDGEHWDDVDARFAKAEGLQKGEKKQQVGNSVPFGRMGTGEDLAGMAVFLASSDAEYIVAQTYNVDGGNWMS